MEHPRTVLVLQSWGIGDFVMTTPLLRAIRTLWPAARIIAAVRSRAVAELASTCSAVDDVILIPRPRSAAFLVWSLGLRRHRIDLAILATRQHAFWSMALRLLGGIRRVAADSPGSRPIGVAFHRQVALTSPEHRVDSNLSLLQRVAGDVPRHVPEVVVYASDADRGERVLGELDLSRNALLLGVHTGSEPRDPQKRYSFEQMREVLLRVLEASPELHALLFFGGEPSDDRERYRGLHPRVHVVADQPLRVVAALIGRCRAFLAADTGLAHIAAARGVSVVVIAGPTQIQSTRPIGSRVRVVSTLQSLACMPCFGTPLYGACSHRSCLTTLSAERVAGVVAQALSEPLAGAGAEVTAGDAMSRRGAAGTPRTTRTGKAS